MYRPRTTTLLPQGIYVGDVTNRSSLLAAMTGVDSVACAVGVSAVTNDTLVKNVEWLGVENQVGDGRPWWVGRAVVVRGRCCAGGPCRWMRW